MTEYLTPMMSPEEDGIFLCVGFAGLDAEDYVHLELSLDGEAYFSIERSTANPNRSEPFSLAVDDTEAIYTVYGRATTASYVKDVTAKLVAKQYDGSISLMGDNDDPGYRYGGGGSESATPTPPGPSPPGPDPGDLPEPTIKNLSDNIIYPPMHDQWDWYSECNAWTCVAETITAAMELFHMKATGSSGRQVIERYCVPYLYGSPFYENGSWKYDANEGMQFANALETAKRLGVPRWEFSDTYCGHRMSKADSIRLYKRRASNDAIKLHAEKQRIQSYQRIDFYDSDAVAQAVLETGCCFLGMMIPYNMENATSISDTDNDGIMVQPDRPRYGYPEGHAMLILGSTTIKGVQHWIVQNSWGNYHGDGGIYYMPYNWGYGKYYDYTDGKRYSWAWDCYKIVDNDVPVNHPDPPTINRVSVLPNNKIRIDFSRARTTDYVFIYTQLKDSWNGEWSDIWYPNGVESESDNNPLPFCVPAPMTAGSLTGSIEITLNTSGQNYNVSALTMTEYMVSARRSNIVKGTSLVPWTWTGKNGSATPEQTTNFYQVVIGKLALNPNATDNFSFKVWNDLVDKANEVRAAYGLSWDGTKSKTDRESTNIRPLLSKDATKVVRGEALSAAKFNSLRYNIGSIRVSTQEEGMPSMVVGIGDTICGYHFTRLAEVINLNIDELLQ